MTSGCAISEEAKALVQWVKHQLELPPEGELAISQVTSDAGFRRYFRIHRSPTLMAALSPPETEDNSAFVNIARFLRENGIHVPKVLAYDYEQGFLLEEDLGETLYFDHLNEENVDMLYGEALFSLLRIQQCSSSNELLAPYDEGLIQKELRLFDEWMLDNLLSVPLNNGERALLDETYTLLEGAMREQPQVVVHRDYHSRNIVYCEDGTPGIIDFQGALIGPVTYDLASLLRDCYIDWEPDRVRRWVIAYANMAIDVGILPPVSEQQFLRWFDLTGLQRHIKVLGIFARLQLRDSKPDYLKDLPRVVKYVQCVLETYPELSKFAAWLNERVIPRLESQPWFDTSIVQ